MGGDLLGVSTLRKYYKIYLSPPYGAHKYVLLGIYFLSLFVLAVCKVEVNTIIPRRCPTIMRS
jgi:hypothetical protein